MKFYSCLFLYFFIPIFSYSQTCIIAIKSKKEIVIGADSKATPIEGGKSHLVCKLTYSGNAVFGLSGYLLPGIQDTLIKIMAASGDFNSLLAHFALILKQLFEANCENIRIEQRSLYNKRFHKDSLMFSMMICKFENDSPKIEILYFIPTNNENESFFAHPYLAPDRPYQNGHKVGYNIVGDTQCFDELGKDSIENIMQTGNKAILIRRFINRQSILTPNYVSAPINIIRIHPNNTIEWISKSQECN